MVDCFSSLGLWACLGDLPPDTPSKHDSIINRSESPQSKIAEGSAINHT